LTLKIRPVMLGHSIYVRVPNDIADLIEVNPEANFTLRLEERQEEFQLIYSVAKNPRNKGDSMALNEVAPLTHVSGKA